MFEFKKNELEILCSAEFFVLKKGMESVTIREICAKAGVHFSMISYYFGSKEKMFSALYVYRMRQTKENFLNFWENIKNQSPEKRMKEIVLFIIEEFCTYEYVFSQFYEIKTQNLDFEREYEEFYQQVLWILEKILIEGISTGSFSYLVQGKEILATFFGGFLYMLSVEKKMKKNQNMSYLTDDFKKSVKRFFLITIFSALGYRV